MRWSACVREGHICVRLRPVDEVELRLPRWPRTEPIIWIGVVAPARAAIRRDLAEDFE